MVSHEEIWSSRVRKCRKKDSELTTQWAIEQELFIAKNIVVMSEQVQDVKACF